MSRQMPFTVETSERKVPGITWWPEDLGPSSPLVLVGHGGTLHKTSPHVLATVAVLRDAGAVVAAIDGPVHGDRRPGGGDPDDHEAVWKDYSALLQREGGDAVAATMTEDWRAALDQLLTMPDMAGRPVGYWGLSMGGRFGIPLVAAEARIGAAVLGMVASNAAPSITDEAAKIKCPILFVLDTNDDLFPLEGGMEVFLAIASEDKRLHVFPGPHGTMPSDEPAVMADFLLRRLT